MSTSQRHIIGRIVLELGTSETADTWTLQSELSDLLQQSGSAEMERLFSQRVKANEVIRLDQLVVELPPFLPQEISDNFVPNLIAALSTELDNHLGNTTVANSFLDSTDFSSTDLSNEHSSSGLRSVGSSADSLSSGNSDTADSTTVTSNLSDIDSPVANSDVIGSDTADSQIVGSNIVELDTISLDTSSLEISDSDVSSSDVSRSPDADDLSSVGLSKSIQTSEWESFLYFLTYGRFPWWQESLPFLEWVAQWETVIQEDAIAWQQSLKQCLYNSAQAKHRLINQLPLSFCHRLIAKLQPAWTLWPTLIEDARSLTHRSNTQSTTPPFSSSALQYLEQQTWLTMLAAISSSTATTTPFPTQAWLDTWLNLLINTLQKSSYSSDSSISSRRISSSSVDSSVSVDSNAIDNAFTLRNVIATSPLSQSSTWLAAIDRILSQTQSIDTDLPTTAEAQTAETQSSTPFSTKTQLSTSSQSQNIDPAVVPSESSSSAAPTFNQATPDTFEPNSTLIEDSTLGTDSITSELISAPNSSISDAIPPATSEPNAFIGEMRQTESESGETAAESGETAAGEEIDIASEPLSNSSEIDLQVTEVASLDEITPHPLTNNPPKQNNTATLSADEQANGIYINQAGLVILHPFLKLYFEDVGLLTDDSFKNEYAQQQAIVLLHYFSMGQATTNEHELVLPKLLCSWPLNDPLDSSILLPPTALSEAENLLRTVITYWDALKTTTPSGLREGFLQRPGKLTHTDGWKLQVEQQTIDILLSRLPWGIGMVKLPWMIEFLTVEWT